MTPPRRVLRSDVQALEREDSFLGGIGEVMEELGVWEIVEEV